MTESLGLFGLSMVYALLLFPAALFVYLRLPLLWETAVAVLRMTAQLALVGLYIELIFTLNSWWVSLLWLAIMLLLANATTLRRAGGIDYRLFAPTVLALAVGTLLPLAVLLIGAVRPTPLYDARYLIPLAGMLLGNCLRANVVALERFFAGLREEYESYLAALSLGATRGEALLPVIRSAISAALSPTIASIATIGLVSLPGMMTGQILGGSAPMAAITYQIAIMIAILSSTAITAFLNIFMILRTAFDANDIPKRALFSE